MLEENTINSHDEAMAAWDGNSVLVRSEKTSDGAEMVYVYPQLGRGQSYHGFSLHHEACLATFNSAPHALLWARGRGYEATEIR